jgi:hypothetical protein
MNAETALTELLDKQAITEQLVSYCRAADRIDLDLLRSVFHEDAPADYGAMFNGTGYGFADFIGQVHQPMQTHSHHLSNILITLDGDRAASESYVSVRLRSTTAGGVLDTLSFGRYLDRWERRADSVWRISSRRYLHTMDSVVPGPAPMFETAGTRDPDDPSYQVLGRGTRRTGEL